jgi:hypothetical protein
MSGQTWMPYEDKAIVHGLISAALTCYGVFHSAREQGQPWTADGAHCSGRKVFRSCSQVIFFWATTTCAMLYVKAGSDGAESSYYFQRHKRRSSRKKLWPSPILMLGEPHLSETTTGARSSPTGNCLPIMPDWRGGKADDAHVNATWNGHYRISGNHSATWSGLCRFGVQKDAR